MNETEMIESEYGYIMPHSRDRGEMGYIIQPNQKHGFTLTAEEMHLVLAIYSELIRRKAEFTLTENGKNC